MAGKYGKPISASWYEFLIISALFCAAVAAEETVVPARLERVKIERPLSRTSTSSRMRIRQAFHLATPRSVLFKGQLLGRPIMWLG